MFTVLKVLVFFLPGNHDKVEAAVHAYEQVLM